MSAHKLLLACGSRTWTDRERIRSELAAYPPSGWDILHGAVVL